MDAAAIQLVVVVVRVVEAHVQMEGQKYAIVRAVAGNVTEGLDAQNGVVGARVAVVTNKGSVRKVPMTPNKELVL